MVDSPPEESAGWTTGDQTLLGGGGRLTDTDGEEAKGKRKRERKRVNCRGQGTQVNLGGGDKGRGGTITIIGRD